MDDSRRHPRTRPATEPAQVRVVAVRGEIDAASAVRLGEELLGLPPGGPVVVDLREVGHLSAAGVRVLRGLAGGGRLAVVVGPAAALVLRAAGGHDVFDLHLSLEDATRSWS
ncbi:STAS domain-containing protein [Actinosynnema sp. NPDC050436]|uniref:STAS domain-containing protein n=1 Tax=Actinosynnema sp. NPDC050436 TaxID=3155659 RepID=UPI0033C26005